MDHWSFFTSKELKPQGWLRRQLQIQANGLSGNLDKIWRDVRDSAWIGKDAEGWERVPYWLDGFVPLAYLLEDEDLICRAKKYIDAIIAHQQPSGWICPCKEEEIPTYDTWAVQLLSKVLTVYYECSGDERIPDVLYRVLKNYHDLLSTGRIKLFGWGQARWFETFVALRFLQKRCDEPWIRELAVILKQQGADYERFMPMWRAPQYCWRQETHIVNLCMMLKYEALSHELLGEEYRDIATALADTLTAYNGTPVGIFTGDECLSGLSPIQGTELCSVAELMYSCEWLYAVTGDPAWADRLEKVAFNALPATISDDMWTHQYDQMSNQIACEKFPGRPIFRTNSVESHLFGLEPGYGCCTANFNQAWPKFALSAFLKGDGEIVSAVPVPSSLHTKEADVTLVTDYPFKKDLTYKIVSRKDFRLTVRIPGYARDLTVNGEKTVRQDSLSFDCKAGEEKTVRISFSARPELVCRPHDLKSLAYGPFIFSLQIPYTAKKLEFERNGVERKFPYCDYELTPTGDWNYAFDELRFDVEEKEVDDIPFSSIRPPVVIRASMRKIAWGLEEGYGAVCAKVPQSRVPLGERETISLVPYGCAKLRMTEMPLI
ncbi:MAG: glycoside hydrolase family 127 protein [Clostridia bacterium]|nr:glycoside hydrolase family 127 protein [Clostridia bacterium]